MLVKQIVVGMITILESRQLEVREDTVVYEDGVELSRTFFRYVLNPGQPVEDKQQVLKDLAALLWTPEVVQAWKEHEEKTNPVFPGQESK